MTKPFAVVFCFVFLFLFLFPSHAQVNPGLKSFIGQSALDYFQSVVVPILLQQLGTISVPDITGSVDTPIGNIDYDLTSIEISNIAVPSVQIEIGSGNALSVTVDGASASATMNWHYRVSIWPNPSDSGSADISMSQANAQGAASLAPSSGGSISLTVQSAQISIGHLDIDLHGGASWLYQIFVDVFSSEIASAAASALESAIKGQVQTLLNNILNQIPVTAPLFNLPVEVDFAVLDIVSSADAWISGQHQGEFYYTKNPTEAPFPRDALPDTAPTRMLQLIASDFFVNSALFSLYEAGFFDVKIASLPPSSPIQLNTTDFCDFAKGLCEEYPDQAMTVEFNATTYPVSNISTETVLATIEANLAFNVLFPNQTEVPAFTLGLTAALNGTGYIVNNDELAAQIEYQEGVFTLVSSEVGLVEVKLLQVTVDLVIRKEIIPYVNQIFGQGIPLPVVSGVSFVNPVFEYSPGFILLETDLSYSG